MATIADGCDQKNTSTQPSRVVSSQLPKTRTATSTRSPATVRRRRCASCLRIAARSDRGRSACSACSAGALTPWLSRAAALLTFIAHQYLVLEVFPDLFVDLGETGLESNFCDIARPRQVNFVVALDRAWPGSDHEAAVTQTDRLFEVMGHEHDRR